MADIFEVYNRCGSCRHFRLSFTDRMGRGMGECRGKPTHPEVSAGDFGCSEYHLQRERLMPGAPVPADADLSPHQREMTKRIETVRLAQTAARHTTERVRMVRPQDLEEPRAPRVTTIPLDNAEGSPMQRQQLKELLAEVIDEALGVSEVELHPRYRGGKVVVHPGNPEQAAKELEVEVLFRKVITIRDKLRVLEQRINTHEKLDTADKIQLQQYISGCYGSLTSFNYLFRDRDDWFVGEGGKGG